MLEILPIQVVAGNCECVRGQIFPTEWRFHGCKMAVNWRQPWRSWLRDELYEFDHLYHVYMM
jgi:hypothetical protein